MRPDDHDLDEEIRGHLALSIKERIERGEDLAAARLAALREFGYVPAVRESMRRVWYSRWFDAAAALGQDMRVGLRSLLRAKGLSATVVITLALGIGANAAIFSVVREVLLRPLVNRDADRLIYIRQSAPGLGTDNMTFSVPEIDDFKARVKSISAFGDFSTIEFTLLGLGEPIVVQAGVVSGAYFDVMGLRPVLGRLISAADDGREAAGVAVLTYRFWSTTLNRDPDIVGKTVRLGTRAATVIGVLEPSVPYPAETAIIANVVTSPHHLGATMVTMRTHRMTELFGRLTPGATLESARAELEAVYADIMREHPESVLGQCRYAVDRDGARRSDRRPRAHNPDRAARCGGPRVHHRVLQCRQPDSGALRAPGGRARGAGGAWRECWRAATDAARGEPRAMQRGRRPRRSARAPARRHRQQLCRALFGARQ